MTSAISMSGGCSPYASLSPRSVDTSKLQQQLFSKVDTNGDKSIDQAELTSFLDYVGDKTGTSIDSASALQALDTDSDGSISESELQENASTLFDQLRAQLMGSQMGHTPPPPPPGDPTEMFASIDADGDGSISRTELELFVSTRAGETGNGPSADEILARDDADGDGSISAAEFEEAVTRGPQHDHGGGAKFERLLSALVNQYTAVSASTTTSLSIAA